MLLTATAAVNGDLMYQVIRWVSAMRKRGNRMMILGAPFEADAQLVQVSGRVLSESLGD